MQGGATYTTSLTVRLFLAERPQIHDSQLVENTFHPHFDIDLRYLGFCCAGVAA